MNLKSKRLVVLIVSGVVFVVGICLKVDPISLGTGITLVTAPYLAVETIRKSDL